MHRRLSRHTTNGFTLIELLLVAVITTVLATLGLPAFHSMLQRNQLAVAVGGFLNALQLARTESVMRDTAVSVCPSTLARTGRPACSGTFSDGWIVFVNPGRDWHLDANDDEILRVFDGLPRGFTLTNRIGTQPAAHLINYLPDGSSRKNLTLLFCPPKPASVAPTSIVMNIVGRPRVVSGWGNCP